MAKKKKKGKGEPEPQPAPVAEEPTSKGKEKPKPGEVTYLQSLDAMAERKAKLKAAEALRESAQVRAAREAEPATARRLLFFLNPLYRMALAFRELFIAFGVEPVQTLRYPVISIGNISVGGAGKTPLTITLAKALKRYGVRVDVLSRGFGRQSVLVERVLPEGSALRFGDEPLHIAKEAGVPVYVAPLRYAAGQLAEEDADAAEKAALEAAAKENAHGTEAAAQSPQPHGQAPIGTAVPNSAPTPGSPGWDDKKPGQPQQSTSPTQPAPTAAPPGAPASVPNQSPSAALEAAAAPAQPAQNPPAESVPALDPPAEPEPTPLRITTPVHLLDDGFQHRQLARNVDIVLVNQLDWKDWLLPAGNLREPREALRRATIVAVPANEPELEVALHVWGWNGPIWRIHRKVEIPVVHSPVAAFCGIARPEQFFASIEASGLKIGFRMAFADHFTYTLEVMQQLVASAKANEVWAVITTAKDLARMGKLAELFPKSMPLIAAKLNMEIENEDAAVADLFRRLQPAPAPPPL